MHRSQALSIILKEEKTNVYFLLIATKLSLTSYTLIPEAENSLILHANINIEHITYKPEQLP